MKRRIVIELDAENADPLVTGRVDADVEFSVRQEILPDHAGAIRIPEFLQRGCIYG